LGYYSSRPLLELGYLDEELGGLLHCFAYLWVEC
jgi:hypothetical protein